jgi:hypothetical protein
LTRSPKQALALKGPNNLAQGNALGWPVLKQALALKGPNNLAQGNVLGWPVPKQTLALKGPNNLAQGNALVVTHKFQLILADWEG